MLTLFFELENYFELTTGCQPVHHSSDFITGLWFKGEKKKKKKKKKKKMCREVNGTVELEHTSSIEMINSEEFAPGLHILGWCRI